MKQLVKILRLIECAFPCGHYEHEKVTGGTIPMFRGWCMHPDFDPPKCTPPDKSIPEWCPLEKEGEK